MKIGFIPREALSSMKGQDNPLPNPAPTLPALEARVQSLENQISQLIKQINGFDEAQWRADYKGAIGELAGGNKKPLDNFMKHYGKIPKGQDG